MIPIPLQPKIPSRNFDPLKNMGLVGGAFPSMACIMKSLKIFFSNLSANAFNLDKAKILSFDTELITFSQYVPGVSRRGVWLSNCIRRI